MKKKNKKKKIIIVIVSILSTVIAFNLLWAINYHFKYGKFARDIGYNEKTHSYYCKEDTAVYYMVLPSYPMFKSNLGINYDSGDKYYYLRIHPRLFSGFKVCFLDVMDGETYAEIWFDEDMDLIEGYDCIGTIDEYKEEIDILCELAYDKWGILINDEE